MSMCGTFTQFSGDEIACSGEEIGEATQRCGQEIATGEISAGEIAADEREARPRSRRRASEVQQEGEVAAH